MRASFGQFELDTAGRTLRRAGTEQPLQPLVFDLLAYLVEHRERVVTKDELLTTLWNGVTVTDGSLQRAVSLLRTTLRDGGLPDAVQTFARRGYKFCEALDGSSAPPPKENGSVSEGRALSAAGHWDRALAAFERATDPGALSAEDWEAWGSAGLCAGEPERALPPLERAVVAFEDAGDHEGAARTALMLTNLKLESRDFAVAKGWHQRALRHLSEVPEGKQHGIAEWLSGRFALFESRLEDCVDYAKNALAIAQRIADPDLRCLGLVYQGHVLIAQGDVRIGLSLHDEAGVVAIAGKAGAWASGVVFCSVIWAYLHLGDHHRASQWTDEFARWCERYPAYSFPALCRLHRGEVLAVRGELASAEEEVRLARAQLARNGPYCEGDACRVLGEILLSRGELDGAEEAFRESHRLGWNPQPGLSLLLAERGQVDAAIKQLERALASPGWTDGQRRRFILAAIVRIGAMHGMLERARRALAELDMLTEGSSAGSIADAARARAEFVWKDGSPDGAEALFREAIAAWVQANAPVHAAHGRLRLAELFLETNDPLAAELELDAARAAFDEAGAHRMVTACETLRARLGS